MKLEIPFENVADADVRLFIEHDVLSKEDEKEKTKCLNILCSLLSHVKLGYDVDGKTKIVSMEKKDNLLLIEINDSFLASNQEM